MTATALLLLGCASARDTRMAEGAGIGGLGGAAIGATVADATRPRHGARSCYYDRDLERRICRYR